MRKFKRLTMTLALLITAVGGAWAEETPLVTIENKDYTSFKSGSMTFDDKVTVTFSNTVKNNGDSDGWYSTGSSLLTVAGTNGYTITSCKFYTAYGTAANGYNVEGESPSVYLSETDVYTDASKSVDIGSYGITKIEVYGTAEPEITEWELKPDMETGKNWILAEMPASNIELQVEYFAESNLFLSKEALADKANIAVKAGDLGVQFGDDGKSANTVTEGTPMTVTYNGTKKLLGMKVEKKAAAAPTTTVTWNSSDFYFDENPYTKDGVTLTPSIMGAASGNNLYEYGDNTFTTTLGKFIKIEIVFRDYSSPVIDGWTKETAGQYQPSPEQLPDFWADIYKLTWTGNADSVTLKGKDVYGILSITFTIQ